MSRPDCGKEKFPKTTRGRNLKMETLLHLGDTG